VIYKSNLTVKRTTKIKLHALVVIHQPMASFG
jgi:hypothetical protein